MSGDISVAPGHPQRVSAATGVLPEIAALAPAGPPVMLGDIALAFETCAREAEEQGKPMADHVTHLIVHATLHLLGYDHIREGDATLMENTEIRILATMGLSNPYED